MMFLVFLCLLQPSTVIPMPFPYRGSNSEEGPPHGPFNYPNLPMSHGGPMFGYGLPHYAQMIQLQQALSQQPFPWQPQGKDQSEQHNHETIAPQMPIFPFKPQTQPISAQQPQHVTKQPLQLPPAPNAQTPPGNYFGYFGFGGRQPYNSEEADEEAPKEKDPPKAEPPVTESSNSTVADTNTTVVDQGVGNNTAHNESFVEISPQNPDLQFDGQRIPSSGRTFTNIVHGRPVNVLPAAHRPPNHVIRLPNHIIRNPQQRYYGINRVPLGNGDQQKRAYPPNQVINKASPINVRPPEKREFAREETPIYLENGLRRVVPVYRNNIQQYPGNRKPIDMSQQREHVNKMTNNAPNGNVIIVYPQDPQPQDETQNIPRGIYANYQNGKFQSRQSETGQEPHFPQHGDTTAIQISKSGTVTTDNMWGNVHHTTEISKGAPGPLQETIYLVSAFPSNNDPHNIPKQNQWGSPAYRGNVHYSAGQREIDIYPENDPYAKINPTPGLEDQHWKVNDFTTQHENVQPQPYSRIGPQRNIHNPSVGQNRKEFYITTNERHPLNQRQFLLISKPGPLKTQEQSFSTNRSSYRFQNVFPIPQKPDSTLDHSPFFTRLETDSPMQNTNIPYRPNRQFDPVENIQYTFGDEIHPEHNNPIDYQISSFPETQPWGYNPEVIPLVPSERTNYGSYPSGLRGQSSNPKEIEMDWNGGSRHYICSLPYEDDLGRGIPNSLLYVCCKLSNTAQRSPSGTVDNMNDFRLAVKEYNDWVPYQDRTHKQHTRNVIDSPKTETNQPSVSNCNMSSANEIAMASGREPLEGPSCIRKACNEHNLENAYQGFDMGHKRPCSARGDNFLSPELEVPSSQGKNLNIQDDASPQGGVEKRGPGKLLRVLTCPQNRQMPAADLAKDRPNAFSLQHDIANGEPGLKSQDGNLMLHQPSEPLSSTADCLILNK
ncbi:hypothetical protein GDO78_012071 [Eleutherodactylus coqui]|uniref:Enamelin n=1 Tax=Eleutherodactylus coqui TaxID=57060 RepID=A0A8J6F2R7_ELECQ|nr:hypothetical protein GDO78_012071 [Eleutherodactylus coqui]